MDIRIGTLVIVLLAACATPSEPRSVPRPTTPGLAGARIRLASAPAPSNLERTAITKKDLELTRVLLTQAREELQPDQWVELDRKLAEAERAWERFEALARENGRPAHVPRATPVMGLVASLEWITPVAAGASTVPLIALLGSLWPASVVDGTLPAWSAAEIALAGKLSELAKAILQGSAE